MYTYKVEMKDILKAKDGLVNSKQNKSIVKKIALIICFSLVYIFFAIKVNDDLISYILSISFGIILVIYITEIFLKKVLFINKYEYLMGSFSCSFDKNIMHLNSKKRILKVKLSTSKIYYSKEYILLDDNGFKVIITNNNSKQYNELIGLIKKNILGDI